jgi:hypothetical protein
MIQRNLELKTTFFLNNFVFLDLVSCGYCKNRRFWRTIASKDVVSSAVTLGFTRPTRRHIPEDETIHKHRDENLKFCTKSFFFCLIAIILKVTPDVLRKSGK